MDDVHAFIDAVAAFFGHLAAVGFGALFLAVVCHVVRLVLRVRAWQNILRVAHGGAPVPFGGVFGAYMAGVGVNALTPARAGDLVKLYLAKRRVRDSSYPTLGSTLVVETLFDFVVASVLLLVALQQGIIPGLPSLPGVSAFGWSFLAEHPRVAAVIGSIALATAILLVAWAEAHVAGFKEKVRRGFAILGDARTFATGVLTWQTASWVARVASVVFFLRAFNIEASFETVLAVLVVGGLATTLPLTPGGLGTQQAVLAFVLAGTASTSAVLSFSVGMQLATIVVNVAIGFGALAAMLRTLRWRDHVFAREEGLATAKPATARSRSTNRG